MNAKSELIAAILEAPEDRVEAALAALKSNTRRRPILPKEATEILGCCRKSLSRYEQAGKLTALRVSSRKIRYDRGEVERLAGIESVGV